jgi:regulator of sigma E protease
MGVQFAQLLLTLTILIVLHEWGHFYFAKKFKCRVEKFYLFFDFLFPISTLLKFSLFKFKKGETEYGIGWFPLGGYVQIAGMVDEQMDKEHLNKPAEPWEFRAKPRWQRMLIMFGGIIMNILVGILIFWMTDLFLGKEFLPLKNAKYGITCDSAALKIGFRNGDKIISIDNKEFENFKDITAKIVLDLAKSVQVERDGKLVNLPITDQDLSNLVALRKVGFVSPRMPCVLDTIYSMTPAKWFDLKRGDRIISINGTPITFVDEASPIINKNPRKMLALQIIRGNDTILKNVMTSSDGTIGIRPLESKQLGVVQVKYGFFSALGAGIKDAFDLVVLQAKNIRALVVIKKAYQQLGGFKTMSQIYGTEWNWQDFWIRTGLISMILAFMNLLPIPMLDGGYILFLAVEMITRRNIPEKFILYANYVGLVLLMALMIYANTDWLRF